MNILYKTAHLFLYLELVSPTLMYYIYDDSPSMGYMAVENSIGAYSRNEYGKKYFTSSYNLKQKKNNDRMIDSHFNVQKMPASRFQTTVPNIKLSKPDVPVITESPKQMRNPKTGRLESIQQQGIKMKNPGRKEYNVKQSMKNQEPVKNVPVQQVKPKPSEPNYTPIKPIHEMEKDMFEVKPNVVQVNVRKTQISTDPQKLRLGNSRTNAVNYQSVYGSDNYKRIPIAIISDQSNKALKMSRVLNEMSQKLSDRRQRKGETRKRDTEQKQYSRVYSKSKRNIASDNMRKYIGKDTTHNRNEPMTDNREAKINRENYVHKDTPYALFYRMNPENVDQQASFMLMNSVEEQPQDIQDDRHHPTTMDGQWQSKVKKTTNTFKLHKKMKNFSTYPNF